MIPYPSFTEELVRRIFCPILSGRDPKASLLLPLAYTYLPGSLWIWYFEEDPRCQFTVFKKTQKKSHSILRAKRATFTFQVEKIDKKMPKIVYLASFSKVKAVLPDRLILIGQKMVENAKIQKFKWNILEIIFHFRMRHFFVIFFQHS